MTPRWMPAGSWGMAVPWRHQSGQAAVNLAVSAPLLVTSHADVAAALVVGWLPPRAVLCGVAGCPGDLGMSAHDTDDTSLRTLAEAVGLILEWEASDGSHCTLEAVRQREMLARLGWPAADAAE
nr:hypothetical protein [Salinicola tamaricis]